MHFQTTTLKKYLITVQIKMSHSIHMLSIQIDTYSFQLIVHKLNNIKWSFFASQAYVWLLNTLE